MTEVLASVLVMSSEVKYSTWMVRRLAMRSYHDGKPMLTAHCRSSLKLTGKTKVDHRFKSINYLIISNYQCLKDHIVIISLPCHLNFLFSSCLPLITSPDALLLYADDGGHTDYFQLKLVEGTIRLMFNLGSGKITV